MRDIKYALIQPDEDGNTCRFLSEKELEEVLNDPVGECGIERFLDHIPEDGPNYWNYHDALLLKVELLKPRVVTTAYSL